MPDFTKSYIHKEFAACSISMIYRKITLLEVKARNDTHAHIDRWIN